MAKLGTIGVVGAGAWGTALALVAVHANRPTILWANEAETASSINGKHENLAFLPGVRLPDALRASTNLADLAAADALLSVVPAQFSRTVWTNLKAALPPRPIVLCAKGVEQESLLFLSQLAEEVLPGWPVAVLSGPSFAKDVAKGLPTAVTLASSDIDLARSLADAIGQSNFRPYISGDPLGAEIGGAVKNVLAIACGIVEGQQLGRSAHAALIARGFAEMNRLGRALGALPETLGGLSGLGDLVLTCSSTQSRNMSLGVQLGQGRALNEILAERTAVTEGVATAPALKALAEHTRVEMPIAGAVADIVSGRTSVDKAIQSLLARPFGHENG